MKPLHSLFWGDADGDPWLEPLPVTGLSSSPLLCNLVGQDGTVQWEGFRPWRLPTLWHWHLTESAPRVTPDSSSQTLWNQINCSIELYFFEWNLLCPVLIYLICVISPFQIRILIKRNRFLVNRLLQFIGKKEFVRFATQRKGQSCEQPRVRVVFPLLCELYGLVFS